MYIYWKRYTTMDEGLLPLIKQYLPGWIISISILILLILFLFKKVRESFANVPWPHLRKRIGVKDLIQHQFFVFITYMEDYKIDRMDFGCPGRTKIFREYFKIRCKTFHDQTKELVTERIINLTTPEIKCEIYDTLYSSIKASHTQMLETCSNDEERYIVNYVVEKFNAHADSSIEAFKEVIETIFDRSFAYETNLDRVNAMLNVFLFAFVATFAETEKVLHKINGEISGKIYKGIKLS